MRTLIRLNKKRQNFPGTSTRSVGVSIPIHVEGEEPTAPKSIVPDNWIDCPFKEHGCHKKGENSEVKRHVRDDRYVLYSG